MKVFARLLILIGFCLGTLGATGFHSTARSATHGVGPDADEAAVAAAEAAAEPYEQYAIPFFAGGMVLLLLGGLLGRRATTGLGEEAHAAAAGKAAIQSRIDAIAEAVARIDAQKDSLHRDELLEQVGALNEGPVDELTVRFEEVIALLGFDGYAKVWAGVATGERLLNRAWSMLADGFPTEAREELPLALAGFREASEAMRVAVGAPGPPEPPPGAPFDAPATA